MARQSVDQSILRIKSLEKKGDLDAAREMCLALIAQYPANKRLRQTLDGLGKTKAKPAAVAQPTQAELEVMVAMFQKKEYKAVVRHGEQLTRRYAYSPILFNILASAAARLGKADKAIAAFRRAIELDPGFVDALNNLGGLLKIEGQREKAAECFTRALRLRPEQPATLRHLAEVEVQMDRYDEAIGHFRAALEMKPDDADTLHGLGAALMDIDELDEARQLAERARRLAPQKVDVWLMLAKILRLQGRNDEAREVYDRLLEMKPDNAGAYRSLSQIHRFTPDDPLIGRIEALVAAPGTNATSRRDLSFALAKAREDLGDLKAAFEALKEGNRLRRSEAGYAIDRDVKQFEDLRRTAPKLGQFALPAGVTPAETLPIFIVALPRSGTSLVEQIVSSHSIVAGGGELANLGWLGLDLATGAVPITSAALRNVRSDYLAKVKARAGGNPI